MIHVEKLSVYYGETPALHEVSLNVAPGEFVLVTGPSGLRAPYRSGIQEGRRIARNDDSSD